MLARDVCDDGALVLEHGVAVGAGHAGLLATLVVEVPRHAAARVVLLAALRAVVGADAAGRSVHVAALLLAGLRGAHGCRGSRQSSYTARCRAHKQKANG